MRLTALALLVVLAQAVPPAGAPQASDGTIVSQTECEFPRYEAASAFTKRHYPQNEYEAAARSTTVECRRIRYLSGGLQVVGFIVQPRRVPGARLPVIVYNRGGFRDIGKLDSWNLLDFYGFAARGFIVLASQYRGSDGGEGRDEVGGADVADVMALTRIAARLPNADTSNLFLYGLSRGGIMTFLALRRGFPARAAAVVGALFDGEAAARRAPKVVASAFKDNPDYAARGTALLRDRTVMNWPELVNVPVLIVHGANDVEVPATEAMAFATKLADLGKKYELIIYAADNHEATSNRKDRDARIAAWFKQHIGS